MINKTVTSRSVSRRFFLSLGASFFLVTSAFAQEVVRLEIVGLRQSDNRTGEWSELEPASGTISMSDKKIEINLSSHTNTLRWSFTQTLAPEITDDEHHKVFTYKGSEFSMSFMGYVDWGVPTDDEHEQYVTVYESSRALRMVVREEGTEDNTENDPDDGHEYPEEIEIDTTDEIPFPTHYI